MGVLEQAWVVNSVRLYQPVRPAGLDQVKNNTEIKYEAAIRS